jgi:hypothetical protein
MTSQITYTPTVRAALITATSFLAGVIYGTFYQINRTITACAFAISIAVKLIFAEISKQALASTMSAKNFAAAQLASKTIFHLVAMAAFRNLNIIGNKGTAFLLLGASMELIQDLGRYAKA